eukprot:m.251108 g.251108  ORF g.251108 m.251108 type:complete len:91 (-) comp15445_c4_seq37:992-1264(-)
MHCLNFCIISCARLCVCVCFSSVLRTSRKSSTSTVFPTSTVKHVLMSTCKLRLDKAAEEEIATQYVQVDSGAFGGGIHDVHAAKKLLECL